jgi:hypothetical protein
LVVRLAVEDGCIARDSWKTSSVPQSDKFQLLHEFGFIKTLGEIREWEKKKR